MKMRKLVTSVLCACSFAAVQPSAYAEANTVKQGIVAENSNDVELLKASFKQGDFAHVVDVLDDVKNKSPEQHNMLISALMNIDLDDAEEAAEQFIQKYSDDYRAYHTHASVMGAQASSSIFSALGYAKKAKKSLERAVEIAPENVEVYQALMQFHLMAPSMAGGDMDEAMNLTQKIAALDKTEGQFALARVYLEEEQETEAKAIFASLIDDEQTQIRARVELGSFYLSDEQYDSSFEILSPLTDLELTEVTKAENDAWDTYQKRKSSLMYGKYRLGQVAVESGEYTELGINALKDYLQDYESTAIDTESLPTPSWAQLRLAELLLNAGQVDEAQRVVNTMTEEKDERFAKVLKKIKKALKKRAAA
ncbi:hypothetical protein F0261_00450 [Alteromonas sp. 07-89-2]|uniref:tetratricopeptide repeat protein n=1 Tax=unclassified Alteromonas TaxID=2614992 RepID=UPI00148DEE5A|nr:tetratricopeptide repeat protein [Alteromonas sp. 07-89-2]MDK2762563.1 tetratricopeptide repeat protein [Alteromonas macleodii]NOH56502.1 hypothetical protein [Alteromonas sp. 07-89-2]|tara:strand:+ start:501 stop:1598 length:1098 start_codon:yes stop_codon:yes gene_type:complete